MLELSLLVRIGTAMDRPLFRSDRLGIQSSTSHLSPGANGHGEMSKLETDGFI